MKLEKLSLTISFILLLGGCVFLPQSSGAVAVGEDEYLIARSNKGFDSTGASVKLGAIKEANAFCDQQNRVSEIIEASQKDMVPFTSDAQAEIRFRCVDR